MYTGGEELVNCVEIIERELNLLRNLLLSLSNQGRVQTRLSGPILPLIECGILENKIYYAT